MIKSIYRGYGSIKAAYLNDKCIFNPPIMVADFVSQQYELSGKEVGFDNIFDFRRAGKAWLIKDDGLQEYAIDVPRFDSGLLIEQAATNLLADSLLQAGTNSFDTKGGIYTTANDTLLNKGLVYTLFPHPENIGTYLYKSLVITDEREAQMSLYLSKNNGNTDIKIGSQDDESALIVGMGRSNFLLESTKIDSLMRVSGDAMTSGDAQGTRSRGLVRYTRQTDSNGDMQIRALQLEDGNTPSSLIVTDQAATTRPADFLNFNGNIIIGGNYISGDWDDTLQLSIVDGQLVHSGHGQIRRLEVYQ